MLNTFICLMLLNVLGAIPPTKSICLAGKKYQAKVIESTPNEYLCEAAQIHSEYQAYYGKQGHQNFDYRYKAYREALGDYAIAEICAESWEWQANDDEEKLWLEAFHCWKQSPGHWQVASKKHKMFGFGKAQGKNKIWYYTIIVAN